MPPAGMDPLRPAIDTSVPHPARIYNYYLGGKDHFAADREAAREAMRAWRTVRTGARENRAFLGRAVRHLVGEAGIRQFLDIGTGLPSAGSVHEVAQGIEPSCRVAYVDNDPIVLAHAQVLLTSSPQGRTAYIRADLRDPGAILADGQVRGTLDFSRPVALMLVGVLHFLEDGDDPARIVSTLLDAIPSGSYLVASHVTPEHDPGVSTGQDAFRARGLRGQVRTADDFAAIAFGALELVDPGVVLVSEWRPDGIGPRPLAAEVSVYGGVGRKR